VSHPARQPFRGLKQVVSDDNARRFGLVKSSEPGALLYHVGLYRLGLVAQVEQP
jgi:hypothetical protein